MSPGLLLALQVLALEFVYLLLVVVVFTTEKVDLTPRHPQGAYVVDVIRKVRNAMLAELIEEERCGVGFERRGGRWRLLTTSLYLWRFRFLEKPNNPPLDVLKNQADGVRWVPTVPNIDPFVEVDLANLPVHFCPACVTLKEQDMVLDHAIPVVRGC